MHFWKEEEGEGDSVVFLDFAARGKLKISERTKTSPAKGAICEAREDSLY